MIALGLLAADQGAPGVSSNAPIPTKRLGSRRWQRLAHEVLDGQGRQCLICGADSYLTCHHIVPRRDGGANVRENLIGLCASDHTTLHLVDRDIPLRSRLLIAAMVVFGPSPAVCRFLRFAFPLLIRRGIGFHPAGIKSGPVCAMKPAIDFSQQ